MGMQTDLIKNYKGGDYMDTTIKPVLMIIGIVLSVVGIGINNWKLAVIGNSVAIIATFFV